MEYKDKELSLCKFPKYLVLMKVIRIRHLQCHNCVRIQIWNYFFMQKKITALFLLLNMYRVFIFLKDNVFFLHFFFGFIGHIFMNDPISIFVYLVFTGCTHLFLKHDCRDCSNDTSCIEYSKVMTIIFNNPAEEKNYEA